MRSKTALLASIVAVTLALVPGAFSAPLPAPQDQPAPAADQPAAPTPLHPSLPCKSLGKGTLGSPLNGIPPNTAPIPNNRIGLTSDNFLISTGVNAPLFEYVSCSSGNRH